MHLVIDQDTLRPLIQQVVSETIERLDAERAKLNGRIGYSESEAAALLGLGRHVLRDARMRGEIRATKVGKRFVYSRDELMRFLEP